MAVQLPEKSNPLVVPTCLEIILVVVTLPNPFRGLRAQRK